MQVIYCILVAIFLMSIYLILQKRSSLVRIICGCCFYSQIYEENVHLLESTGSKNTLFGVVKHGAYHTNNEESTKEFPSFEPFSQRTQLVLNCSESTYLRSLIV